MRKTAAPKGRKTIGKHQIKVSVYDGVAMRTVTISTDNSLLDLLEKVCTIIKRPNTKVEMGYKAPWSSKIRTKKVMAYISNEEELDDFWLAYARHLATQKKKSKANAVVEISGIVFHNILDGTQVSGLRFKKD